MKNKQRGFTENISILLSHLTYILIINLFILPDKIFSNFIKADGTNEWD